MFRALALKGCSRPEAASGARDKHRRLRLADLR